MTPRTVFFCLIGEFFRFFRGLLYLSAEDGIGLYGFSEIQVPNLNLRQEAGDNGIVSFCWFVAIDGSQVDLQPLDI